jgi:myo-inositol-1-phosphate synthase
MGAVATTLMAGVMLARRGLTTPVGSMTQLGVLPKTALGRPARVSEVVPLARLDDLVFGGWDLFDDNAFQAAEHAEVLGPAHLAQVKEELSAVKPMPAVFYPEYVRRLHGTHLKKGETKAAMVEQVREDIRAFLAANDCTRAVGIWCGSTEIYVPESPVHATIETFEQGLRDNHPSITNSQIYAWAFLSEGIPFANASPNLSADFPAAYQLATERRVPLAGKDLKTGQTLMKTVLGPALRARLLGVRGWFSTNILGNRDGEVLDDPDSFKTKEVSKLGVLENILSARHHQELYGELYHKVRIEYYPPRGDAKEGWDNIDLFGWMGYPMQLKVNFLCRDSILAAPLVLDIALLLDLAHRAGLEGPQEWLSFFFKSPVTAGGPQEHDFFVQKARIEEVLGRFRATAEVPSPVASGVVG